MEIFADPSRFIFICYCDLYKQRRFGWAEGEQKKPEANTVTNEDGS